MKKYLLPLLSSILLLGACTGAKENTSSSSEEISSDSSIESSSSESEQYKALNALADKLFSLEGEVKTAKTIMNREFIYPGTGSFTMNVKNVYETTRYTHSTSDYVVETNGTETIEGSSSSTYKTQIYNDTKKFYKVTAYEGESNTVESNTYDVEKVEATYDVGPAQTEIANFQAILLNEQSYAEKGTPELFEWTFDNIEGIEEDEFLKYSYTISIYQTQEGRKTLTTSYKYENTFTIKNDLITKLEQKYEMNQYVSSATNTLKVSLTTEYTQGQFEEFTGTLLSNKKTLN